MKKLNLNQLRVKSFVTSINTESVKGGAKSQNKNAACNVILDSMVDACPSARGCTIEC